MKKQNKKMTYKRRTSLSKFEELSEDKKQQVIDHITRMNCSIESAAKSLNMTRETINKIFAERFGKRDRAIDKMKETIK